MSFYSSSQLPAAFPEPPLEFVQEYQRQERAEHVALDGSIPLVKQRTGVEHRLGCPEELLHHQEPLILHRDLIGSQIGVGSEDKLAVITAVGLDLLRIQGYRSLLYAY